MKGSLDRWIVGIGISGRGRILSILGIVRILLWFERMWNE